MESLSYTLLALVVSRLPWESRLQLRLSSRRLFDLKKQWSGALLEGESSLLGDFIDYTRSLAYSEEPDYARWRHRFRSLVPELPDDPLYEAADCSGPTLVANVDLPQEAYRFESQDDPQGENLPRGPGDPLTSGSWPDPSGSGGDWIPTSTWVPAVPLEEDELLGDESMIVTERIDVIDEVPKMHKKYLSPYSAPELMRTSSVRKNSMEAPNVVQTCEEDEKDKRAHGHCLALHQLPVQLTAIRGRVNAVHIP